MKTHLCKTVKCLSVLMVSLSLLVTVLPASAELRQLSGELMLHDPTIIRQGGTWYAFGTGETDRNGIRRLKSDDGQYWYQMPDLLTSPLWWWSNHVSSHASNQWAPDIVQHNGRYYLLYSVSSFGSNNSLIGMLSTTNLESNSWRDDGLVVESSSANDFNAIDGDITFDANGTPWLSFGSFWSGIKVTQLNSSDLKITGGPFYAIASRNAIEAPRITYRNGYYYLFVSFDSCCNGVNSTYKIAVGRSSNITGPYVDKNGTNMMNGGGTILQSSIDNYVGTGGQDVLQNELLISHGYDTTQNGLPQLLIQDLYWDSQGWPTLTSSGGGGSDPGDSIVSGATYTITNRASGLLAEVTGASTDPGADVIQWSDNGGAHQRWVISDVGSGYYNIINARSGNALEIYEWSTSNGGDAVQYTDFNGNNQHWRFIDLGNGHYRIENRHSGLSLDGYGTSDGSDIIQYDYWGGSNQQWRLDRAN